MISAFTILPIPSREQKIKKRFWSQPDMRPAPDHRVGCAGPRHSWGRFPEIRTLPKIVKFISRQVAI
jgi:hypothetical protein